MDSKEDVITNARAKYVWGDKPEIVKEFLLSSNQFGEKDANELLIVFRKEVTGPIRIEGIKSMIKGGLMILLFFSFYYVCLERGFIPVKPFILLSFIGLYGLYKFIDGLFKTVKV